MDKKLVRTLLQLVGVIIQFRHSQSGLLLSELGGYLLTPERAQAGTKRISNLLRGPRWHHGLIARFLWQQGDAAVTQLEAARKDALCMWDECVWEKLESIHESSQILTQTENDLMNLRSFFLPGKTSSLNWESTKITQQGGFL